MRYNLSEINEVIQNRRTVKPEDFSSRTVHREQIELLLENARWAPTHGMTQPWHFKVYMEEGRKELSKMLVDAYRASTSEEGFNQMKADKLAGRPMLASAVLVICMKRQEIEKIPEIEEIEAVACAVQNMHLTAAAYGLGAYWNSSGVIYSSEFHKKLGLGAKDKCLGLFYIGYPEGDWPKSQRRPIEYYTDWITS